MYNAIKNVPKPTLIACKTARRAGAVAALYIGAEHNFNEHQAREFAESHQLSYPSVPILNDFVLAGIGRHRSKGRLIFRQFFESESSTYTYVLGDSVSTSFYQPYICYNEK